MLFALVLLLSSDPSPCRQIKEAATKTLLVEDTAGIAAGQKLVVIDGDASAGTWAVTQVVAVDGAFIAISPALSAAPKTNARVCLLATTDRELKRDSAAALLPSFNAAAALELHGLLTVNAKPWGEVWVDGVMRAGETPMRRIPLRAGSHTLKVTNPGAKDIEQEIVIFPARETMVFVDVSNGTMEVRSW